MALTKINSNLISNNTVANTNIADNAVDATKIASNSILTRHIDDAQITTDQILDGTIATADIADDAVTADKLANAINTSIAAKLPLAGGTMTGNIAHAGTFAIDVGGDIHLDADGGTIRFKDGGTTFADFTNNSGDLLIQSKVQDKDIVFYGDDNGTGFTALTLDMSEAGAATFNSSITFGDGHTIGNDGDDNLAITGSANENIIIDSADDIILDADGGDVIFRDGGVEKMRLDAGNLGIGENNPANLFHVKASDAGIAPHPSAQIVLERDGTNYLQFLTTAAGTSGLLFGDTNDIDVSKIYVDHNTTKMTFVSEASETMTLHAGKVGIGTTSPISPLHVENGAQSLSHSYAYAAKGISIESDEPMIQLMAEDSGTHGGSVLWRYGANVFAIHANPTTDNLDFVSGVTSANSFDVHAGGNMSGHRRTLSIGADGKVGIGIDPTGILHVDGHTSSVASIFEGNGSGDTVPVQLKVKANNGTTSTQGLYGNAGSASTDNTITLGTNGTTGLTIDNLGNLKSSQTGGHVQIDNGVGVTVRETMAATGHAWQANTYNVLSAGAVSIGSDSSNTAHMWWNTYDTGSKYNVSTGYGCDMYLAKSTGDFVIRMGSVNAASNGAAQTLTEAFRITKDGKIGMGNGDARTDPYSNLHVAAGNPANIMIQMDADTAGGEAQLLFKVDSTGPGSLGDDRIKGAIIMKRDDPGTRGTGPLHFCLNSVNSDTNVSTSDAKLTIATNGVVSGDLNDTSDLNFKENVADLDNTLEIIKQLKPRTFTWKDDRALRGDSVGFIAQEVKSIMSDERVVQGTEYEKEGDIGLSINTIGLVAYLTKALQEQQTIIDDLKARIEILEG